MRFQAFPIHRLPIAVAAMHKSGSDRTIRPSRPHPLDVNARAEVNALLQAAGGLVSRRDHPDLAASFDWLVREGRLTAVLPGVSAASELAHAWQTRVRALGLRHRDAVLLGAAAARVSFWPDAPLDRIEAAVPSALKPQPGFFFNRRYIPAELIIERAGLRYSVPALTAIALATFACSDAVDIALRARAATLAGMYEALRMTPHRAGNRERLQLLIDSRGQPWSAAERLGHRLLRAAHIKGWETNLPVLVGGQVFSISTSRSSSRSWRSRSTDGCMRRMRISSSRTAGGRTHSADGWRVLRFTVAMLRDHAEVFIAAILDALH